ncbi:MAG: hypothetical protein IKU25_05135 [Clostridia bacterium]|nr:hypothetical protein [Clostridia bacterium]
MEYRYSVTGTAKQAFILRGFYFPIGKQIDMPVSEAELPFVKAKCNLESVIDLAKAENQRPMPVRRKTSQRGSNNESVRKRSQSANQGEV